MSKTALLSPRILLAFLTFILHCFPFLVLSLPPLSEKLILLRIRQQWGNQPPMQSWNSTTSHCDWPGIICTDGENVTGISLNSRNMGGEIPESICDLKHLTLLDLGNNMIRGKFPTFLYNCTRLKKLNISLNYFDVGPFPNDIHKLSPNLQHLSLSGNSFAGDIPTSLAQLKGLITLRLGYSLFNGTFPSELGNLEKLEELVLAYSPFLPANLPKEFGMLKGLKLLRMTRCNLIGKIPDEFANLTSLEHLDLTGNGLVGRIPSGVFLLKNLTYLYLSYNTLKGEIPSLIAARNLVEIDLSRNEFNGMIPKAIGNLQRLELLDLSDNQFWGEIPAELTALSSLQVLRLHDNQLTGELPVRIISWQSLVTLDLSQNDLSGPLPAALGSLTNLHSLDISNNKLSGHIPPELEQLTQGKGYFILDFSHNNLSGKLPHAFDNKKFHESFLHNANLCSDHQTSNLHQCSSSRNRYLVVILVPGGIIFPILVYFAFFKINMGRQEENSSKHQAWELKPFHRVDFTETTIVTGLTDNNMIGYGGSGKVYSIIVNDSGDKVAVKSIWNGRKLVDALEKQFLTEVEILGTIRHANIVKLLCCVSSAYLKLLVYEYMENQSLDKWIHKKWRENEPLSMSNADDHIVLDWPTRLRIAIGAAKGLCYLHNDCSPPIIHRDVKSSNILLDLEFNAKIADFGLAKLTVKTGEPHTASSVAGSFGYIAPEYWQTNRLNDKIDVYSFGVVLLELATGKHPCKGNDHLNLAVWSWQHCCEERPIIDALDEDIKEPSFIQQMVKVFKLGLICTSKMPSSRPSMKQVLQLLNACSHYENHGQTQTQMVNEE